MKKTTPVSKKNKQRIVYGFGLVSLLLVLVTVRMGWVQLIDGEEYSQRAISQQVSDSTIQAQRGNIYDRNGKELATTTTCYTLWVRPSQLIKDSDGNRLSDATIDTIAENLSLVVEEDFDTVRKRITSDGSLVKVSKYLTKEQRAALLDVKNKNKYAGIEITEDTRRFYPLGNFASQVLGSVNDDNMGRSGLELQYNSTLTGTAGRWIKNKDNNGNELVDGTYLYNEAKDGLNVITTLDETIQYYVEDAIRKAQAETLADRVMCIVMDPKTGEILGNGETPGYDPNYPMQPDSQKEKEKYNALETNEEKSAYLFKMWRNGLVSDTYEPGSTFKLITASAALEEKAIGLSDTFSCNVTFQVADYTLKCWSAAAHGTQTIKEALGNSCNPCLAAVAKRLGATKFLKYLDLFGITEKTGVDYPGEASAIIQQTIGPVELATMGYGQGISLTPLQLLTAASAIANDGYIMQPRYVKALTDKDGNVVQEFEPVAVRQVISSETAKEMLNNMEYVVSEAGGKNAKIEGYRIGGKTGTANKVEANGKYGAYYYSSFLGVAPIDDPQFTILVIVDSAKTGRYGSILAAPVAKDIMENILRYMNIEPETDDVVQGPQEVLIKVPELTDMTFESAKAKLNNMGLKCSRMASAKDSDDWKVVDQYPKAGEKVPEGSVVYLYKE